MIYKCCNVFVDGSCARLGQLLSCGSISQENTLLSVPSAAINHYDPTSYGMFTPSRNRPYPSPPSETHHTKVRHTEAGITHGCGASCVSFTCESIEISLDYPGRGVPSGGHNFHFNPPPPPSP